MLFFAFMQVKSILFWLYLWQLKNYHFGRFKSHFSTAKGRGIFLNKLFFLKLLCIPLFFVGLGYNTVIPLLLSVLIILIEGGISFKKFVSKSVIAPKLTKKAIVLLAANLIVFSTAAIYASNVSLEAFLLLSTLLILLNILTPIIVSLIVFLFQPITVFLKFRIIRRAKKKRAELKNLKVIGITGSYGKSSTKEFLFSILSSKFKNVKKTPKNINSELGISEFINNELNKDDEYFICEMGAYNKGGIKLLCQIADPQIGILTGINNQHLSTFGSQENIVKAKFELVEYVKDFSVLNWDNFLIQNHPTHDKKVYKCSYKDQSADGFAKDIKIFKDHLEFIVAIDGKEEEMRANVLGKQNISNLLLAIFVACKLGLSLEEIKKGLEKISPKEGGMEIIGNYIDATYSSNANGVIAHLEFLECWKGRRAIVMPCLIELGGEAKRIHEEIGKKILDVCDLGIITSKDYLKDIKKGGGDKIIYINNPDKIIEKIKGFQGEDDIVLLESRIPKRIIKEIKK